MKKLLIATVSVLLTACAVSGSGIGAAGEDRRHDIDSFKSPIVEKVVSSVDINRTLFVFDIDNTLLQNPPGQFFGSAQWYDWQGELEEGSPAKVKCKLEVQGAAYFIGHMEPTEDRYSVEFVQSLQRKGADVIALTARSPQFRFGTERELKSSSFDFSESTPLGTKGLPGFYQPRASAEQPSTRNASFQNGVAMLAGQHKGAALIDLLERVGAEKEYDTIVFFDDDDDNIEHMLTSFRKDARTAIAFYYKAVDRSFDDTDVREAIEAQNAIAKAYAQFRQPGEPGDHCDMP